MKFKYKGFEARGVPVAGDIEADSRKKAVQLLANKGVKVFAIGEVAAKSGSLVKFFGLARRRLSDGEFCRFFEKLAQLCRGGLTLADAVESIARNSSSSIERFLGERILEHLHDGISFVQAAKKCCNSLDNNVLSMLALGDLTGQISNSLGNVAMFLRRKIETKKRFIAGLSYPLFICAVAFAVVLLFLFYLMPKMSAMIRGLGGDLPIMARSLVGFSKFLTKYSSFLTIFLIIIPYFACHLRKTDRYRLSFDKILAKIPLIGPLQLLSMRANVSNILASLAASGVAVSDSINVAANSIVNAYFKANYSKACDAIFDGMAPSMAFKIHGIFEGYGADLIAVGETTGDMAATFSHLAEIYDEQLSDFLKKLTAATSSIALLFAFSMVAVLALSIVSSVLSFSAKLTT